jgi:hypothetical protein
MNTCELTADRNLNGRENVSFWETMLDIHPIALTLVLLVPVLTLGGDALKPVPSVRPYSHFDGLLLASTI